MILFNFDDIPKVVIHIGKKAETLIINGLSAVIFVEFESRFSILLHELNDGSSPSDLFIISTIGIWFR